MTMFSHSVSIFTSSLISALSTLIDKPSDRRLVLSLSRPHFQALFPPQLPTNELILGRDLTQPWFSITESPSALQSFPCSEVRLDLSQKSQSSSTKISGDRNRKWGQLLNYFTYSQRICKKLRQTPGIKLRPSKSKPSQKGGQALVRMQTC